MNQEFVEMAQLLETQTTNISTHLRWLMRHAMLAHCGSEAVDLVAYCKDIPVDAKGSQIWGEAFAPTRSIAINLECHFFSCVDQVQAEDTMNTSIRTLIIRELLDTIIHEAHHLKCSYETGDFTNSQLEEEEAKKIAWEQSWKAAKYWDVEVKTLGTVLDDLLEDFITGLREDVAETPEMWKDLQIHMWDNELAFYNPDMDQECKMREAFETMAKDDNPWLDDPKQFLPEVIEVEPENLAQSELPPAPEAPVTAPAEPQTPLESALPEPLPQPPVENVVIPPPPAAENVIPQPPVAGSVVPPPPEAAAVPAVPANVLQIQQTIESVIRTLFVHVMSKCGFNTEGGYNNPAAVLEPVSIHHIPGALELFTHMDTTDEVGVKVDNQPCNGMIKGRVTAQNLPMYKFYMSIGGELHKRTFIPQNPNKLNQNQEPTAWAQAARDGAKIMMLLAEGTGPKAHLRLEANTPFGQEEFKIWSEK